MTATHGATGPSTPLDDGPDVTSGLDTVRGHVAAACADAGRDPSSVTLVAVSKTVPAPVVERAVEAGQLVFGENRVQEAKGKWPEVRARHPGVRLHLLGPLQSNKVRDAVALFDAIHSVDRPSLCAALARECAARGRQPELFMQVNVGAEEQKAGVAVGEVDALLAACRDTHGLTISGLMCIPPVGEPPEPHFRTLAEIAGRHGLAGLSMGMSMDFAAAIGCGATHVRVGSAIFGARPPLSQGAGG